MSLEQSTKDLGSVGEALARDRLTKSGYHILEQNYRCSIGEIDVIAKQDDILCFIEVKTRTSQEQGHPLESITSSKQRKISLTALHFLQEQDWIDEVEVRFDVVAILNEGGSFQVEIVKNAFDSLV